MRRLILLRHAKSAWPSGVDDHERPLNERGRDAAPRMGAYLSGEHLIPDLALVSTAQRTRETWDLMRPALPDVPVRFEKRIYEASAERLSTVVHEVDAGIRTLLMVGHNPGFQELARALIGHGDRNALARLTQKYPTAGLAVIDFAVESWADTAAGEGRLDRFVTPKALGGVDED